jgi:hypothetical protein
MSANVEQLREASKLDSVASFTLLLNKDNLLKSYSSGLLLKS